MKKWTQTIPNKIANTECLIYSLVKVHLVKYLTQSFYLNHLPITKCTPNLFVKYLTYSVYFNIFYNQELTLIVTSKIANTEFLLFSLVNSKLIINHGTITNVPKTNSVEHLTRIICFNHWSIIKLTQILPHKISNTMCLLYSLVKTHLVKQLTQSV